jgi:hypothetical protein
VFVTRISVTAYIGLAAADRHNLGLREHDLRHMGSRPDSIRLRELPIGK